MITPNKIADANTEEWQELRKTGIGASEASAACGLSPYRTQLDVYHEKVGQLEPAEETDFMRMGKSWEPLIQSEFEHRSGIKVLDSPCGLYRSPDSPFMLATPDALLAPNETGENELGEWKATTFRRAAELGEQETDNLPPDWVCQCQQQLYVMGLSVVHVAVLLDVFTLKIYRVERNDRLIDGIVKLEKELWERIENHDPPPPVEHPQTLELARELYHTVADGSRIELSDSAAESWRRERQAGRLIKKLKARQDFEKAKVLLEIGDNFAGVLPGGEKMIRRKLIERASYTVEPKSYIDTREVKYDGGVLHIEIDPDELATRYEKADRLLRLAGFGRHEKSEWGSAYYIHHEHPIRVRVSDHSPNRKTREWMERTECVDLRIDRPDLNLKDAISELLKPQETNDVNSDSRNKTEAEHATHETAGAVQKSPSTT